VLYEGCQKDMIHGDVEENGCYFLSIARLVELQEGKDFSAKDITVYWNAARLKGLVNQNFEITNAAGVYNLFAGEKKYKDVIKSAGKPSCKDYIIRLEKPNFTHYVLSSSGDIWDSLPPDRPAAKTYKPAGYRVFV
jgi:hypothetical protein